MAEAALLPKLAYSLTWNDVQPSSEQQMQVPSLTTTTTQEQRNLFLESYPPHLRRRGPFCCKGVLNDYQRRLPHYCSDILNGFSTLKTISSTIYMFFFTWTSAVALGILSQRLTKCSDDQCTGSYIGISEYLLVTSISGMLHSLFGAQPLLVLRPTGTITVLVALLFNVANFLEINFLLYLAWVGLFVGFYMILIAGFELSRFISFLTRFAHEILACFVCSIYVVSGLVGMIEKLLQSKEKYSIHHDQSMAEAMLALLLTLLFCMIAFRLHSMRASRLFTTWMNRFFVDYSLALALMSTVFISLVSGNIVSVEKLHIYSHGYTFRPSLSLMMGNSTVDRSWWTPLWGNVGRRGGAGGIGASTTDIVTAALCAVPITLYLFLDQNLANLLCQKKELMLRKGSPYFHSSWLFLGIFNSISLMFGLPLVSGSCLLHAPQFAVALREAKSKESLSPKEKGRGMGEERREEKREERREEKREEKREDKVEQEKVEQEEVAAQNEMFGLVVENRVAPFLTYLLVGLFLLCPVSRTIINIIPDAAVDGILIVIGVTGVFDTQLYKRVLYLVTCTSSKRQIKKSFTRITQSAMHLFTVIQLLFLGAAWTLSGLAVVHPFLSPLGLCFPVVMVLIVPFRLCCMQGLFTREELEALDDKNEESDFIILSQDHGRQASFGSFNSSWHNDGELVMLLDSPPENQPTAPTTPIERHRRIHHVRMQTPDTAYL